MTSLPPKTKLLVNIIGAMLSLIIALALLFLMLFYGEEMVRHGVIAIYWFSMLVMMGLAVSAFLFLGFKSYASYTGKQLDGKLTIGGPAVVMFAVIMLGPNPPTLARFDQTVFVHGESGHHENVLLNQDGFPSPPTMELFIGTDKRRESIGEKGEVRFVGIPADQLGKLTNIKLNAEGYELVEPKAQVKLSEEPIYVAIRPTQVQINGKVQDKENIPVAGAELQLGENYTAVTNDKGWFQINVPSNLPETERNLHTTAPGFQPDKLRIIPGGGPVHVILTRK